MTDGDPSQKNTGEGFGGGISNPVMKVQVALTIWAYNSPGLEDLQFVNWEVINRGDRDWDRTYFGVVVDPDLGFEDDDYIGCDTNLNLGYCYNGTNSDPEYGTGQIAILNMVIILRLLEWIILNLLLTEQPAILLV